MHTESSYSEDREKTSRFRILIVDDDLIIGENLRELLNDLEYSVDFVRSGPEAVKTLISDMYDAAGFSGGLDVLRYHGYQPRVVHIYDPADTEPTLLGDMELVDVETNAGRQETITERRLRR